MVAPVFKTGEGRQACLVGSTPTLFRHKRCLEIRDKDDREHQMMRASDNPAPGPIGAFVQGNNIAFTEFRH